MYAATHAYRLPLRSYQPYLQLYEGMSLETFVQIANALEIPTDLLLTEQLKGSTVAASHEIAMILSDCSDYEKLIIIDAVKTIKATLRKHHYLLKRFSQ